MNNKNDISKFIDEKINELLKQREAAELREMIAEELEDMMPPEQPPLFMCNIDAFAKLPSECRDPYEAYEEVTEFIALINELSKDWGFTDFEFKVNIYRNPDSANNENKED